MFLILLFADLPTKKGVTVHFKDLVFCLTFLGYFQNKLAQLSQQLSTHIFEPLLGIAITPQPSTTTSTNVPAPAKRIMTRAQAQKTATEAQKDLPQIKSVRISHSTDTITYELSLSTEAPPPEIPVARTSSPPATSTNSKQTKGRRKGSKAQAQPNTSQNTAPVPVLEPGI